MLTGNYKPNVPVYSGIHLVYLSIAIENVENSCYPACPQLFHVREYKFVASLALMMPL